MHFTMKRLLFKKGTPHFYYLSRNSLYTKGLRLHSARDENFLSFGLRMSNIKVRG
jgi:hypothetical protein